MRSLLSIIVIAAFCLETSNVAAQIPTEPVAIGFEPQFVFDNWIVDNHWAIRYKRQAVKRVFHQARRHGTSPVLEGDQPSYVWVARDEKNGRFQMYYQANFRRDLPDPDKEGLPGATAKAKGRKFETHIAYAESPDGIHWTKPDLKLFPWHKHAPNNIVIGRLDSPTTETCGPVLLDVPKADRRGYRHLMLYRAKGRGIRDFTGIRIIGSHDGIRWDADSDTRIAHLHSDHHNTVSFDPRRGEYVMYCRAKHIYRAFGDTMLDTGASRRVARFTSPSLWSDWLTQENRLPQTILIPDAIDSETHFNFFYGMPTRYRHGIYWGFLEPFRMNDFIQSELAVSRDGMQFQRFTGRKPIIPYGEEGSWNDEMIFVSPAWIEVDDEWWLYYSGWDGPHGTPDRTGAIGLAKIRKEGFVSMRGPIGGGVVCTRALVWPGGPLFVNTDASEGELKVRISDVRRRPIEGFDYEDCLIFSGDDVRHEVQWNTGNVQDLAGKVIRLEFYLKNSDLYAFQAGETVAAVQ